MKSENFRKLLIKKLNDEKFVKKFTFVAEELLIKIKKIKKFEFELTTTGDDIFQETVTRILESKRNSETCTEENFESHFFKTVEGVAGWLLNSKENHKRFDYCDEYDFDEDDKLSSKFFKTNNNLIESFSENFEENEIKEKRIKVIKKELSNNHNALMTFQGLLENKTYDEIAEENNLSKKNVYKAAELIRYRLKNSVHRKKRQNN